MKKHPVKPQVFLAVQEKGGEGAAPFPSAATAIYPGAELQLAVPCPCSVVLSCPCCVGSGQDCCSHISALPTAHPQRPAGGVRRPGTQGHLKFPGITGWSQQHRSQTLLPTSFPALCSSAEALAFWDKPGGHRTGIHCPSPGCACVCHQGTETSTLARNFLPIKGLQPHWCFLVSFHPLPSLCSSWFSLQFNFCPECLHLLLVVPWAGGRPSSGGFELVLLSPSQPDLLLQAAKPPQNGPAAVELLSPQAEKGPWVVLMPVSG